MLAGKQVLERAKIIGDIEESEESALLPFCDAAAGFINGKTRADADASDVRLLIAAAAIALSRFLSVRNSAEGDISSFKAGDVTVSYSGNAQVQSAENLRKATLEDASDLLIDGGFAFQCV